MNKEKIGTDKNVQENLKVHKVSSTYLFLKRAVDIIGSFFGLIVLSPLFLVIAICIKVEDGGNVFYKHKRVGKNGSDLYIYKFRSMKTNADDLENMLTPEQLEMYLAEFKIENDPRITKVGNFLRKTSLDELPQMVNILKGDLTIIGPRPVVKEELENYGDDADKFLSITPGLTGYWQAYARNEAIYATGERQNMELYYVENRSLLLDIKIFFKTFSSVFGKTGN
ncbi:MAG: sugar transferase [Clostridia bacterium]|nr:sugar transferase [Clostridia bacterium]